MCGLVGIAGKLEYSDEVVFKRLLVFDYFRGTDSTGAAFIPKNIEEDVKINKIASHPIDLFDSKSFTSNLKHNTCTAFIGHNRAATKGKVNATNAHPFTFGDITGAHNGTLKDTCWKSLEKDIDEVYDVDSAALFASIDKQGIEKTIKSVEEGLSTMSGAWALVWYNKADNTLNFLRNKHRPLWFGWSKDCKKILWASEWQMIDTSVSLHSRTSLYKTFENEKGNSYFPFAEDTWYKFDLKKIQENDTGKPVKPTIKKLKGKEPAPVTTYVGTRDPFQGPASTTSSTTTSQGSSSGLRRPRFLAVDVFVDDIFASTLSVDVLDKNNQLCDWCYNPVDPYADGHVWIDPQEVFIGSCCSMQKTNVVYLAPEDFDTYYELVADDKDHDVRVVVH